jgi:diguanylate cyclase (GGDEF)-like protein/PAS domain S-box-containing protein
MINSPEPLPLRRSASIKTKLNVLVLLGTVGTALAVAAILGSSSQSFLLQQARLELDRHNIEIAAAVDMVAEKAMNALLLIRQDSAFDRYFNASFGNRTEDSQALAELQNKLRILHTMFAIDEACVINSQGREIAREVDGSVAIAADLLANETDQAFFAATMGLKRGEVYRSPLPYVSEDTHKLAVAHATPIVLASGEKAGVLHLEFPFAWFTEHLSLGERDGHESFLVSSEGLLLVPPGHAAIPWLRAEVAHDRAEFQNLATTGTPSFRTLIASMRTRQAGTGQFLDSTGAAHEVVYRPVRGGSWILATMLPHTVIFSASTQLQQTTLLAATPLIGAALLLVTWFARRLVAPLRTMTDILNALSLGEITQTVPRLPADELGEMALACNRMVEHEHGMASMAEAIANGDFSRPPSPRSSHDTLGQALLRMYGSLSQMTTVQRAEARFRSLVQNAWDTILVLDATGTVTYASPSAARLTGCRNAQLLGHGLGEFFTADDDTRLREALRYVSTTAVEETSLDARIAHVDGTFKDCEVLLCNRLEDAAINGIIATCHDLTERKSYEAKLAHTAFHDALTNLPNRALFRERVEHALARSIRTNLGVAVMFLDLDNFKVINDSLGHDVGDRLLIAVAERVVACARGGDTVARLAGDEFTILLEDCPDVGTATHVAQRVVDALKQPLRLAGHEVVPRASIGIAYSSDRVSQTDDLLRCADAAMYQAKAQGKGCYALYDQAMGTRAMERLQLEGELRLAIEHQQIVVHYQPIVDLVSGQVCEFEALVRWQHPEHGLLPPLKFIEIAEESGLIVTLGSLVMHDACRQLSQWQQRYPGARDITVNVNLSPRQFEHGALLDDIKRALDNARLDARFLKLEITESLLIDQSDVSTGHLQKIRELGVKLAIDDFGTGYSCLAYLKSLPVDVLKIDRSFVNGLCDDGQDRAIAQSIVALAQSLNLTVIAEGVETQAQADLLRSLGCEKAQGYLYGRPAPAEDAEARFLQRMSDSRTMVRNLRRQR